MPKNEFSEILNNIKYLTIGQLFQIFKKLRYTAVIWLITIFSSCMGAAYVAGQYEQQKETGVALEHPFAMRIEVDGTLHDFNRLTLIKDPSLGRPDKDKVALSIRKIKNEFDIVPIGKIVATVDEKELKGIWKYILSRANIVSEAHAKPRPVFDLNDHKGDYKFKEKFVKEHTVHRYYSDGCILEYKVDSERRPIPDTFRWIKKTH